MSIQKKIEAIVIIAKFIFSCQFRFCSAIRFFAYFLKMSGWGYVKNEKIFSLLKLGELFKNASL